ncbi:MAG: FHA domain-containing protein [Bacteroidales bacterium]|nr:FHA domain-containing protein [Bacteroidales bacterium]MBR5677160.1 FHA domain-containing protein [Paludibacteraceae bacterium]
MARYKKCPNGHSYPADRSECPICNSGKQVGASTENEMVTQIIRGLDADDAGSKTTVGGEAAPITTPNVDPHRDYSKTMVEDEIEEENESGVVTSRRESRAASRLVGWLVTYSLDPNGTDFRLYEGRNIIGKDFSCGVCINDSKVSSQHAILLYRNEKFRIKDNLSTNGTIVNGVDIDDESVVLNDGDVIQIGETILLFRTAELTQ